jgi:hypothetical protein
MRLGIYLALTAAAVSLGGCGGPSGGGGNTCNPGMAATITINSTGVTPAAVCVLPTGTVTFTNSSNAPHRLVSTACLDLDTGVIAISTSVMKPFPTAETCAFQDFDAPSDTRFQGTVAVTTAPVGGPGY